MEKKENGPTQQNILGQRIVFVCDAGHRLPLSLRNSVTIDNAAFFPEFVESKHYRDDKFFTYDFYKPISQLSKLI